MSAARQLRERGHVVIRGALPADIVGAIGDEAARFFADFQARMAAGAVSDIERELFTVYGNLTIDAMLAAGFGQVAELFPAIRASAIAATIAEHFGDAIVIPRNHVLGRCYRPPYGNVVPFHQDRTVIDPRASVTSWIPLNECGAEAPGLELADELVLEEAPQVAGHYAIDPAAARWPTVRPIFKPGDAVLFLNTTPHRSHVAAGMTRPRLSFEVRYMPRGAVASGDDPANLVDVTPQRKRPATP